MCVDVKVHGHEPCNISHSDSGSSLMRYLASQSGKFEPLAYGTFNAPCPCLRRVRLVLRRDCSYEKRNEAVECQCQDHVSKERELAIFEKTATRPVFHSLFSVQHEIRNRSLRLLNGNATESL